jgi:hypothetical protein
MFSLRFRFAPLYRKIKKPSPAKAGARSVLPVQTFRLLILLMWAHTSSIDTRAYAFSRILAATSGSQTLSDTMDLYGRRWVETAGDETLIIVCSSV